MTQAPILAIFAHPDDETFGFGGTMARYAERGHPVTVVSATKGEVGQIAPGSGATPETLPEVRANELRDAMRILGVDDVRFLGFRDSGMQGTDDNTHDGALMNQPADAVVGPIVRLIREVKPGAVVTWDASGGYGHPDHVAIHQHATAAFHAAGDAAQYPDAGPPYAPSRLFYTALPVEEFARIMREMVDLGISEPDVAGDPGLTELPRVDPNCVIDVTDYFERKERAFLAHRTQMSDLEPFLKLPVESRRRFFGLEYFYRASPPVAGGATLSDLWE